MIETQKRIRKSVTSSLILIKTWRMLLPKYKDTLGRNNKGKRLRNSKRRSLRLKKKSNRKKDMTEMLKRTKKLGKNFSIQIRIWMKQLQKSKDISERSKLGKRKRSLSKKWRNKRKNLKSKPKKVTIGMKKRTRKSGKNSLIQIRIWMKLL